MKKSISVSNLTLDLYLDYVRPAAIKAGLMEDAVTEEGRPYHITDEAIANEIESDMRCACFNAGNDGVQRTHDEYIAHEAEQMLYQIEISIKFCKDGKVVEALEALRDAMTDINNNTEETKGDNTMTTNNTAANTFPHLYEEINAAADRQKADTADYITLGYMTHWAENNRPSDRDCGLKRYSTETRWNQYQRGEISREKAVEFAIKRAARQIDKDTEAKLARLESVAESADSREFSVGVTWSRSSVWGYNPSVEATSDTRRTFGKASGCGYDKESAAIAEALNQLPAALRVLYVLAENALVAGGSARSKSSCTGYCWNEAIGYGSGYSVLPYFEGGVGSGCFWSIFQKAGYTVRKVTSSKRFDCWTLNRSEA